MKILIGLLMVIATVTAQAQGVESHKAIQPEVPQFSEIGFHLLNADVRAEKGASQDLEMRSAQNIGLSYTSTQGSILVEYAQFTEQTGNMTSFIERHHQELMAWGRYHLLQTGSVKDSKAFRLHAGVGLGSYEEKVTTTLMGDARTDKGAAKFMSGLELGADMVLYVNDGFGFSLGADARGLFASDFNPNPTWSGVVRLGLIFPL